MASDERLKLLPNALSLGRLLAAPVLVLLALTHHPSAFLILLSLSLFSDTIDGPIARALDATSERGARLDSFGDLANYTLIPPCALLLWPNQLAAELPFVVAVTAGYGLPVCIALLKFHKITSYHTYLAKAAAVSLSIGALLLVLEITPWLFRIATILLVISAMEEITITLTLPRPQANVRSYFHVRRKQRNG